MQQSIETLLNLNMILIEKNIDRKIICSAQCGQNVLIWFCIKFKF
jgi:hypothetical protein